MRIIARPAGDHHAVIGRSFANKTLDAREPALINLPIPLPSIPVLTPILSPLIAGNNQNSGSGTTTTTATSVAAPAQTSSSSGSSGGSTGGSTGGSSGGDTGGSSGGNTGGGTTGGSTGTDTTGTGTGSTGGSTTTSPGTGDTEPGSSSGSGGATGGTTTGSGTSTSGNSGSSSSGGSASTNTSNSTDSSPSSNYNSSGDGATAPGFNVPGMANAGNIPSSSQSSSTGSNVGSGPPTATGGSTTSTNGAGGETDTGVGDDPNTLSASSKGGLSGGAIAGIIICVLLLLIGLVVFTLRKRSRARRDEQANQWWFTRKRTSQTYGDRNSQEILAGAPSARSSFATTVDHSRDSPRAGSFVIPPLPPMAEVGRDKATAPMFVFESSHFNSNSNSNSNSNARFSVGSAHSENSQYLVVHHRDSLNPEIGTPMSVRPFSPSESFAFPKPPEAASARNSVHSRPATASSTHSASGTFSAKDIDDAIPPTPALPQLHLLQSPISPSSNPFADNNPFDDPAAAAVNNGSVGEFAETETIRRPFHPTLPDELKVRPDDIVHIIQSFDDGWALVEKLDVKGKGKEGAEPERGLIPVDCLREPGLDLPAFCAAKRMSSYTGPVADGGVHAL